MKRKKFWKDVSRFVTPAALIVLGLVLLFCPDTASALISRVAGWALTFSGIVVAVAMVVDGRLSVGLGCLGGTDHRRAGAPARCS